MTVALITHRACEGHDLGPHHPECPQRLRAIHDYLLESRLDIALRYYDAPQATWAQLQRVHDPAYLEWVAAQNPAAGMVWLDPDTGMLPDTLEAALRAAGAVVLATDLVLREEVAQAFCAVRPPGHHAESGRAMGFCLFNNIAVGVAHALANGLERVAVIDFDVHHGNGTEEIFHADERVLLCSTFRHPYYPFSGADSASPHIVNVPLAVGSGGEQFREAVRHHWLPALEQFRPQMLFISAGFDAHAADEMGGLRLREGDYQWITAELKQFMVRLQGSAPIISALEGGYETTALARSVAAHLRELLG